MRSLLGLSPTDWLAVLAAAVLTGLAKTAVPGLASIAVALYALVLPAKESTGVMLVLLLVGDVLAVWAYRRDADRALLARLVPSVVLGVLAGAAFLRWSTQDQTRRGIGVVLLALGARTVFQRQRGRRGRASVPVRTAYGALAGFTTMVANAGGPVTSMYFLACRFSVAAFLGTTAWFFFAVNLVKLPFTVSMGLIRPEHLALDLALAPVVVLAALAGRRLAARLPLRVFEPLVIATTVIAAVPLVL